MLTTLWVPKGESDCPPLRVRVVGKEGVKLGVWYVLKMSRHLPGEINFGVKAFCTGDLAVKGLLWLSKLLGIGMCWPRRLQGLMEA